MLPRELWSRTTPGWHPRFCPLQVNRFLRLSSEKGSQPQSPLPGLSATTQALCACVPGCPSLSLNPQVAATAADGAQQHQAHSRCSVNEPMLPRTPASRCGTVTPRVPIPPPCPRALSRGGDRVQPFPVAPRPHAPTSASLTCSLGEHGAQWALVLLEPGGGVGECLVLCSPRRVTLRARARRPCKFSRPSPGEGTRRPSCSAGGGGGRGRSWRFCRRTRVSAPRL